MMKKIICFLIFLWSVSSLSASEADSSLFTEISDQVKYPILTPSLSNIEQKKIRLENGMNILLISDPSIDKSGAAINVKVGSWDDPDKHLGMAHFCEHMLFLGTEKYPDEDSFSEFLSHNGGTTNAFTSLETTCYMFSCKHGAFDEAMDRFSQFFVSPLFSESGVKREKNAIHNEFALNIERESRRFYFVLDSLSPESHPQHRFKIGNLDSLAHTTSQDLRKWYEKHYSSHLMHGVIISNQSMDDLLKKIPPLLNEVPIRYTKARQLPDELLSRDSAKKLIKIKPLKNIKELQLVWELPISFAAQADDKPEDIAAFILGHEGKHSLLSALKSKQLAESLSSGGYIMGDKYPLFTISIRLTPKGLENYEEVLKTCFAAINYFKFASPPRYILDEVQQLSAYRYQYRQRTNVFEQLQTLISLIHQESFETFPEKQMVLYNKNPRMTQKFFKALNTDNLRVFLTYQDDELDYANQTSQIKVKYDIQDLNYDFVNQLAAMPAQADIAFPEANPFIPKELIVDAVLSDNNPSFIPQPKALKTSIPGEHYYLKDERFLVPEAIVQADLISEAFKKADARTAVLAELLSYYIKESLNEFTYVTSIANIIPSFTSNEEGFSFQVRGYNDKIPQVLREFSRSVAKFHPDKSKFDAYKQTLQDHYLLGMQQDPISESLEIFRKEMTLPFHTYKEKLASLETLSFSHLEQFSRAWKKSLFMKTFFYGNLSEDICTSMLEDLDQAFETYIFPKERHLQKRVLSFEDQKSGPFLLNKSTDRRGNVSLLSIEGPSFSFKHRAAQQVLNQILKQPFWDTLRTKQQTAYALHHFGDEKERILRSYFIVYSNTHDARDILSRIELFIEDFLSDLRKEPMKQQFETIKASLIKDLSTPPQNMPEMASLLHLLIDEYNADFTWMENRLEGLKNLSFEEFSQIAIQVLNPENKKRLAIILNSTNPESYRLHYQEPSKELAKLGQFSSADQEPRPN